MMILSVGVILAAICFVLARLAKDQPEFQAAMWVVAFMGAIIAWTAVR